MGPSRLAARLVILVLWGAISSGSGAEIAPGADVARVLRVGVLTDNEPFSAGPTPAGFAVDLLAGIERIMALRFERVTGTTDEINGAFLSGRLDLLQSYARSPARDGHADFSVPYLTMHGAIFVRRGLPEIRTLADLRGRRVLVHAESLGERVLRAAGLADSIVPAVSVEDALRRVDAGEGDATLAARLTGMAAIRRLGLQHIGPQGESIPGYEVAYCFAVRDGDRELLAQINEGLAILERTGEADAIYRRWLGPFNPKGYSALHVVAAVAVGLAVALVVMIWAALRQRTLRRRIAAQAGALRESEERLRVALAGLEERVRDRTRQLEVANQDLEAFSYSVSHDLRTPLRAILGFAQLLVRRHGDTLDAQARRYVENIMQGATRMGRLIDDLLNLSRLGRSAITPQPVALAGVLAGVTTDLAPRVADLGAHLGVAPDLPVVLGDRTLLQQVFANLLDNALTYRKPGVAVDIRVSATSTPERVTMAVRDNGLGIAPEHHEKIFHAFQRLHGNHDIPGTGIGLAIVKKSVELLGGRVSVQSTPGEGSVFSVELLRAP